MAAPGRTWLGPYELAARLGAGGMGEVYRARDTRLDRTVAIKILREDLKATAVRQERFEREARVLSGLSHPHICSLYEFGHHDNIHYLVLEYCEGETLADRLARKSLRPAQVLRHAIEIVEALAAAHQRGITHRDLKPGNVMLTSQGIKLLDFGLAKIRADSAAASSGLSTLTGPDGLTADGAIVGTLNYMAPEQLEGKDVDARADIFAFGAVLYEMITGRRAFEGTSRASVIAAILEREPAPVRSLQPLTTPALERVVRKCLAKSPDERWQTAGDLADELRWIAESDPQVGATPNAASARRRERVAWITAGALALVTLAFAVAVWARRTVEVQRSTFGMAPPDETAFVGDAPSVAVSPNGRYLAFIASPRDGSQLLWVRDLDSGQAQSLPGTDDANQPFWSPDSQYLGFFAGDKLKIIALSGGAKPQTLCDAPRSQGGSWSREQVIVFTGPVGDGIKRISVGSGNVESVTTLDTESRFEAAHSWPYFLPDGRHFLYRLFSSKPDYTGIYLGSLDDGRGVRLDPGNSSAAYVTPGYLLFHREATLYAQPFDLRRLRLTGTATPIAHRLQFNAVSGAGFFGASDNGVLALRTIGLTQLAWFDRRGTQIGSIEPAGDYRDPSLSPDESRLAVARTDPTTHTNDIWLIELPTGKMSRLTFDAAADESPVWSENGERVLYSSNRELVFNLYVRPANGTGRDDALWLSEYNKWPADWGCEGRFIAFHQSLGPSRESGLQLLSMIGQQTVNQIAVSQSAGARFSPDCRWIAFTSRIRPYIVHVKGVPTGADEWPVSKDGGSSPQWRRDGQELFYMAPDNTLMAVSVTAVGNVPRFGTPQKLFTTNALGRLAGMVMRNQYVAAADGKRFLVNTALQPPSTSPITVILNWTAGLR